MSDHIEDMLDEIAAGLRAGDDDVREWLRDQLEEAGAGDTAVELAMGVIARLTPKGDGRPYRTAGHGPRRWLH